MNPNRDFVFSALDGERDYQDTLNSRTLEIGEEILLLEEYTTRARKEWAENFISEESTMDMIRKVGGIALRCMEHHGVPKRKAK